MTAIEGGTVCPTHCSRCGQALLIRAPGRDVCARQRCRAGSLNQEQVAQVAVPEQQAKSAEACAGCGGTRTEHNSDARLPLADGYCLLCRLDGRHS